MERHETVRNWDLKNQGGGKKGKKNQGGGKKGKKNQGGGKNGQKIRDVGSLDNIPVHCLGLSSFILVLPCYPGFEQF